MRKTAFNTVNETVQDFAELAIDEKGNPVMVIGNQIIPICAEVA